LIGPDVRRLDDEFFNPVLIREGAKRLVDTLRAAVQDVRLPLFDAVISVAQLAGKFLRLLAAAEIESPAVAQEYPVDALTLDLSCRMSWVAGGKHGESNDGRPATAFRAKSRKAATEDVGIAIQMTGKDEIPAL